MLATRNILAFALALLAFAGLVVFGYMSIQGGRAQPAFATIWPAPKSLGEFSLVDQSGTEFTRSRLKGQWSLLFFGFTHCPDICPATLQQLAIANKRLAESGHEIPDLIFVSVDPERDSPDALADYVGNFSGKIYGVTGEIGELRKLTSAAGIFFEKSALPDGGYSVDHSAAVLVIDESGAIHASFGAPHDVNSFINDLPILMGTD